MVKGYKGFNQDLTCKGFQYEIGKSYEYNGEIKICCSGFHFCRKLQDVQNFYDLREARVCEIEAYGTVFDGDKKSVCDHISIIRELSHEEILSLVNLGINNTGLFNSGRHNSGNRNSGGFNSGDRNSGRHNSGNRNSGGFNSGDRNSGDFNSGDRNSGDFNSGGRNSGDFNSGGRNSGDFNSGDRNSGDFNSGRHNSGDFNSGYFNSGGRNSGNFNSGRHNSGNRNSGDFNSGSFCACNNSSGLFMTKKITYEAFNKQLTEKEYRMLLKSEGFSLLQYFKLYSFRARTEKNGKKYLSYLSYKASWRMFWQKLTPKQKLTIKRMPHFDADVFYEITGIKVGQLKTHHKE